jgi:uncharacterized protein
MRKPGAAVQDHPILIFILLTYAITWLAWAPSIAASRGLLPFDLPQWTSLPGSFGPGLAAVLVLALRGEAGEIRSLLRRLLQWRVPGRWYFLGFFLPLLLNVALLAVLGRLSGHTPELSLDVLAALVSAFLFFTILGGPLGEEPGWRGFLLPRLLGRHNALKASLVVAGVWFGWHLPRYLDPQLSAGGWVVVVVFALQSVVFAILHTWIYANTRGSLFLLVLFHASINTLGYMAPIVYPSLTPAEQAAYTAPALAAQMGLYILWAVLVVVISGPMRLSRKDQPEEDLTILLDRKGKP